MSDKKKFVISKTEKGIKGKKALEEKIFHNKDSYSAAKKAATAIFRNVPKNKKTIMYAIKNKKTGKELPYTATKETKNTTVTINGNEVVFKTSVIVKSADMKDIM
jgi:hypothetical protein